MNCWHCNNELIWGGDHDTEENEDYDIVSNLSCPNCHTAVDVWHPSEKLIKEEGSKGGWEGKEQHFKEGKYFNSLKKDSLKSASQLKQNVRSVN